MHRARIWLDSFSAQNHDFHARLLDETPRQLLMADAPVVDLRAPTLYGSVYRRKTLLLYFDGGGGRIAAVGPACPRCLVPDPYCRTSRLPPTPLSDSDSWRPGSSSRARDGAVMDNGATVSPS